MIDLKDISYSYDGVEVFKDINMKINKGESLYVSGPNGSGKSTLFKIISGILYTSKGTYTFNNEIINEKTMKNQVFSKKFHKEVGFVFQNPDSMLFNGNVYDEIAFGPRQMELSEKEVQKRTDDCLKLLKIEHLKDRAPYHLSGGEKRKVSIAAVISLNPSVIIFDEPFNDLDDNSCDFVQNLITNLNNIGKTIILATHDKSIANSICTSTIVL